MTLTTVGSDPCPVKRINDSSRGRDSLRLEGKNFFQLDSRAPSIRFKQDAYQGTGLDSSDRQPERSFSRRLGAICRHDGASGSKRELNIYAIITDPNIIGADVEQCENFTATGIRSLRTVMAVTDGSAQPGKKCTGLLEHKESIVADTGERREIKERTDAKEEEVVAESKKLLQESVTESDQILRRRGRVKRKGTLSRNQ